MRIVIQRVIGAQLFVNGLLQSQIGPGVVAFVGIAKSDTERDADYLAAKLSGLRIFPDAEGKMNRSVAETGGEIMLVSNFTLYGDTAKGKRPSFDMAARPEAAQPIYNYFVNKVRESGIGVETGVFQAEMRVVVENDGPVTLICDSPRKV